MVENVTLARTVQRVGTRTALGPDAQGDDRAIVIGPDAPHLTDPFLVLSEDWFSSPGFEWHPHRGLETVTLVLDGVLEHGDNAGNSGALEAGDVQWMTAGRGIIHRELAYRDEHVHTLQLWVNLPARSKMIETRYQDLRGIDRPALVAQGTRIDVIAGSVGDVTGPARTHWPIRGSLVTLDPGSVVEYPLAAPERAFVYVVGGTARVGDQLLGAGQIGWIDPVSSGAMGTALTLGAPDGEIPARLVLYSGEPIGEPVVIGGPFVMNERTEILRAFEDFRSGGFGPVPRQMRLGRR